LRRQRRYSGSPVQSLVDVFLRVEAKIRIAIRTSRNRLEGPPVVDFDLTGYMLFCTVNLVVHLQNLHLRQQQTWSSRLVEAVDFSTTLRVTSFARFAGMASCNRNMPDDWCDLPPHTETYHFPALPHHGLAALPSCSPSSFASLSTALCCNSSNRLGSRLVCTGKRAGVLPDKGNGSPAS
jgi:hypothetical protein